MADVSLAELPAQIALALSLASSSTGTDLAYLTQTAGRESSFQADARAKTSSATGLFQFIEETWIRTIKDEGARFGLADYADLIERTPAGRYSVPDAKNRRKILELRNDPAISAMMAAAYARRNGAFLAAEIGRQPTSDELYFAHFMGPADAARLITLHERAPQLTASILFPRAAEANRTIFFDGARPRSVEEVHGALVRRHRVPAGGAVRTATVADVEIVPDTWVTRVRQVFPRDKAMPLFGDYTLMQAKAVPVEGWEGVVDTGPVQVSAVAEAVQFGRVRHRSGSASGETDRGLFDMAFAFGGSDYDGAPTPAMLDLDQ